ncbi:NERD domain-containing protein [Sulfurospirillum deleyianum]|uniref:NERD domain-containing protein n=1 Tax=Sulfurospirillum deleyianum (strain ATCC 51133 / DSM 6946 / 5175) TaxID=525898 RepID=D1B1L9_SULD5|nr:NERD domain-containing protein [Sulfurospirillum deleyianum]ACZ11989.1 conserved hypothetical protein [Sulfurospirillum deleyianum DSM 6946]
MKKEQLEKNIQKGKDGEQAFLEWLDQNGFSYLYINQDTDSFPQLFKNHVKRPDFLVLIDSIGLIAVDVKNYKKHQEKYCPLPYESELKKTLSFERMFRIPVWYAYKNEESSWLWISALKAVEVGKLIAKEGQADFLSIKIEDFTEVTSNQDIGKLWEQRLPSFKNNHNSIDDKHTKKNS